MPRRSLPITTVRPGEHVRIDMKSRRSGILAYIGRVVATDAVAFCQFSVSSVPVSTALGPPMGCNNLQRKNHKPNKKYDRRAHLDREGGQSFGKSPASVPS